jgi:cytoskeletal protein CcmA (bactofilin family)
MDGNLLLGGQVNLSGGTMAVNTTASMPNLSVAGSATLAANATLTVTQAFTWTNGTLTGSGTLNLASTLAGTISSVNTKTITGALVINQAGTINWTGGTISQNSHTGAINNTGLFDIQGDLTLGTFNAFGGSFNNTGTLRKSAGEGTAVLQSSVQLANAGTIEALAGTLIIQGGIFNTGIEQLHTGAFRIGEQGELRFGGGTHRIGESGTISGPAGGPAPGIYSQTGGTLTMDGNLLLGGQVNLSGGTMAVNTTASMPNLSVAGSATLAANATLTVTQAFTWTNGTLTGSGTLNLASTLAGTISSANTKTITGALVINQAGTINWTGGTISQNSHTGAINNTGLFDIQGDLTLGTFNAFGGSFNNTGTLRKSAGEGTGLIEASIRLANTGIVEVLAGTLIIRGGIFNTGIEQLHTGAFRIGAQGELQFGGGTHRIGESGTISGPAGGSAQGIYSQTGGTLIIDGDLLVGGQVNLSGGTMAVNTTASMPNLSVAGSATLAANATLTVTQAFTWTNGTLTGSGTLNLASTLAGTISSANTKTITGALVINQAGTINWTGGTISQNSHTGAINNTGLFDIQGDLTLGTFNAFGGSFNNTGTLRKSAGEGTGLIEASIRLANTGIVEVLAGTLIIRGGIFNTGIEQLHTGAFRIGALGELQFGGGTHRIGESGTISGPAGGSAQGIYSQTGGTLIIDGDLLVGGQVNLSGGTLIVNATLTVTQAFTWTNGTLTGSGTLTLASTLAGTISSANTKTITGALVINQAGTINWTGGTISQNSHTGAINNTGLFDIQGDLTLGTFNAFGGSFNNTGTLRKSAGEGTAVLQSSVQLANAGTIEALAGTLIIQGGIFNTGIEQLHTGAFRIGEQGELRFGGGTHRIGESGTISGPAGGPAPGIYSQTGGTLTMDGNLLLGGQVNLSGGTMAVNTLASMPNLSVAGSATLAANATLTVTQAFTWTNGTLTGSGTLNLASTLAGTISSANTKTITGALVINQAGTINWTGGTISQNSHTGAINNTGLFDIQGDLTLGTFNAFGGSFNNTGTLRKSAGEGTAVLQSSVQLANAGTIEALAGTLIIQGGIFNTGIEQLHTGAFRIGEQGELRFGGGTHRITGSGVISGEGTLALTGGTFLNDGTISPGLPTGILNVTGNIPLNSSTSALQIGLAGNEPGVNQDQLIVSGSANLGGNLVIDLEDGFEPEAGQDFTVLRAASVNNEFSSVQLSGTDPNNSISALYTDTTVVVRFSAAEPVPPIAVNDTAFTLSGSPVNISVLTNDSDPQGRQITVTGVTQPENGTSEIIPGNLVRYTPVGEFTGTDQFEYTIANTAGLTATALVTVFVQEAGEGEVYTWVGGTGNWSVASNWNPAGVPGINDQAIINTGNVTSDSPLAVSRLTLNSTLIVNSILSVNDTFTWTNGTLSGSGSVNIPEDATWNLTAGSSRTLDGTLTINMNGTASLAAGFFGLATSAGIVFNNTGLFDLQSDLGFGTGGTGVFRMTLNNTGIFRKSAGEGIGSISSTVRLNNPGTIEVLSGRLDINSGQFTPGDSLTYQGTFIVADEAALFFGGGIHTIGEQAVFSGPDGQPSGGTVGVFANGGIGSPRLTLNGDISLDGLLSIANGTIRLNRSYSFPAVTQTSGTLTVNNELTITNTFTWTNGTLSGSGSVNIPEDATWNLTAGSSRTLDGTLTINMNGTASLAAGFFGLATSAGIVFNNTGLFDLQSDLGFGTGGTGVFRMTLNNTGIFRKSAGEGIGSISSTVRLNNPGTIEVLSGRLDINSGQFTPGDSLTYQGTFIVADEAALFFGGGIHTIGEQAVFSGPDGQPSGGTVGVFANGGIGSPRLTLNGDISLDGLLSIANGTIRLNRSYSFPAVTQTSGTLTVNNELTITNTFTWTNGTLSGSGSVNIPEDATWNLTAGSSRTLDGTLTINMNGTASLAAGFFGLATSAGIVFNNTGLFDLQSDLGFGTGGTGVFRMTLNNTGIFRKSAGEGIGSISSTVRLNNPGTIEVLSGRLDINSGQFTPGDSLTYQGTFIVADEAALFFGGGIHTIGEQAVISGPDGQPSGGTVGVFANGGIGSPRLTLNGDIRVNGTISQTSGTLTIHPTGLITGNTTILLSSGTFINNGTLSPGDPLGIINVTGNLPFSSASAVLEVELGGNEPGTSQDQVIVSGSSGLNGTLSVLVTDGFVPEPGQEFVVLRAGAISGTFSSISHPDLGEDRIFLPVYTDSTVAVRFTGAEITRPIAINDSVSTPFNTAVSINVLANDISPAGDPLSIIAVTQPANGTAGISGDSLITYTPASGFSGVDSFIYTISSDREEVDSARVTVTVLEQVIINNAPVAVNDTASTVLNLPVLVDVLANDSDPDGDPVSVLGFENPTDEGGNVVLTGDDRLLYTPPTGFTGSDSFRYSITDGRGGADTALVVIEVFPVRFEVVMTGAPGTRAMAIDEDGAVAGNRVTAGTPVQGFYMAAGNEVFFNTGPFGSQIYGIAGGRMAGIVMLNDTSGTAHLFSPDGTANELGTLGGTFSLGYAVNTTGLVTGVSTDSLGRSRAFITDESGVMSVISSPGFQFSTGYAVNRDGAVAGMVSNPGNAQRAWVSGQVKAEPNSRAYSINTGGDAAGSLENQGQLRAAYWTTAGETVILPSGSEPFAEAYGINDAGWIVGSAGPNPPGFTTQSSISAVPGGLPRSMVAPAESITTIPEQLRAVVWISESLFDLNELIDPTSGWTLLEAAAINSSGQIAGTGIHQGSLKAFVLSPVDEEPPLAIDFAEATAMGTELIIDLGSLNGSGVRVVQVSRPDNGTVNITGETTIRYIPASGYLGADRFRYTLSNGRSVSHGYITVAIESVAELPERMMLGQNYPNPFNPGTVIPVSLPETTDVRLEVFDLLGRFVLDVFNGTLEAGEHHLTVDAARLSSGTYIYRLSSTAGIQTRKMTLLK